MQIDDRALRLHNGLTVRCLTSPGWTTFAGTLDLGVGWADDPPEAPGLAHLVARLYGVPHLEALATSGIGYSWSCLMSDTVLMLAGHPNHLDEGLAAWAKALVGRAVAPGEIRAALREMRRADKGTKREQLVHQVRARLVGDAAIGRVRMDDVRRLSRVETSRIAAHHARGWSPGGACLTLLAPEADDVLERVVARLGASSATGDPLPLRHEAEPVVEPLVGRFVSDGVDALVMLLHRVPRPIEPERTMLLSRLVSSALQEATRDVAPGPGWVGCDTNFIGSSATCEVWLHASSSRVVRGLRILLDVLGEISSRDPDELRLLAAKRDTIEWLEMMQGDPSKLCEWIAGQGMRQARVWEGSVGDLCDRLARVEGPDLTALARRTFVPEHRGAVLVGPMQMLSQWRARRILRRDAAARAPAGP